MTNRVESAISNVEIRCIEILRYIEYGIDFYIDSDLLVESKNTCPKFGDSITNGVDLYKTHAHKRTHIYIFIWTHMSSFVCLRFIQIHTICYIVTKFWIDIL